MPKLPKGIYKRGRSFYARIFENGRERRFSLGPDYVEACRKFRAIRDGKEAPSNGVTVERAAQDWLRLRIATGRNPQGIQLAESRVRMYLVPIMGARLVQHVTSNDLLDYRVRLERTRLSPLSVRHVLSDARCFFLWCLDSGLLDRSPVPRKLLPRICIRERTRYRPTNVSG